MNDFQRLKFLGIATCAGLLAGIFGSLELWFPVDRTFPRAPLFFSLEPGAVALFERCGSIILIVALTALIFGRRLKIFGAAALAVLALLIFFDQTRLQPWVYQYFLLLVLLFLHDREAEDEKTSRQTLALGQILIAGLYFWSGAQKLNYTFAHEMLPFLLSPLENLFPAPRPSFVLPGVGIALFETLIGAGLLFRKTRNAAVAAAVLMHLSILILLVAKNYNSIVWIWNPILISIVVILFWGSEIAVAETVAKRGSEWKTKTAKAIVALSVALPVFSFCGFWDMYLAGALYSANTSTAVVRVNMELLEKLPPAARQTVFSAKNGEDQYLPLFEWSLAELNVPVYPEKRVFRRAARELCRAAADKSGIALIVKERPAIFDGSYRIDRLDCAELER